ncbi:MAG: heme o synthase [Actinomycetota bacterium]|nr:heme o synthase [Actinomycetota bacterium]
MTAVLSTRSRFAAYLALTKPRIIELLLVTTVPTMVVAQRGMPEIWLIFATLVGGTLAAAGANATNMVIDRDIDSIMKRTQKRPLVTGEITPRNALVFAIALELLAAAVLWLTVNPLSALLAVSATLFYVFVYSLWLKRTSTQNIVIGGAAGAVPVLVGWAAVTGTISWAPVVLFAIIFAWTPPHFWALAVRYRDDYSAANVPMLPSVATFEFTSRRIVAYTLVLWAISLAFWPVGEMGLLYGVAALVLGGIFTWHAVALARSGTYEKAMRLFGWSITYITLLFGAMAVDQLLPR